MLRFVLPILALLAAPAGADADRKNEPTTEQVIAGLIDRAAAGKTLPSDPLPPDDPRRAHLDRWKNEATDALTGVTRSPLPDQPWGKITMRRGKQNEPTRLYLFELHPHASGDLIVYGLGGKVRRAYRLGQADAADIPHARTERATTLSPPRQKPAPDESTLPATFVLELENEPTVVPIAIDPSDDDGSITLHARDVIVHGHTVRYEPQPHKNTVGYWMEPSDWVRWDLNVKRPGKYSVEILQGCGPGSGNSEVEISVGDADDQRLRFIVQETKGFQDFIPRDVGTLTFPKAGTYSLNVKPIRKPGVAVMDLRMVTLKPASE